MKILFTSTKEILKRYKQPDKHTHKGIQGHALLIGGSYGKIGAVSLSSKACLKTGCGLVTILFKMWVHYSANRDSRSHGFDGYSEEIISNITFEIEPHIGIGPGLGQAVETQNAVSILKRIKCL
jgi:NAD(P)H-hydrate repair Nnr-like enzyme with NAD(P)H-hydrate dehydratase domain